MPKSVCIPLKSSLLIALGRALIVLFASNAVPVAMPKVVLCKRVPLGSTLVVELECLLVILWDTFSIVICITKRALGVGKPLKSSLLIPLGRALVVLFASPALFVAPPRLNCALKCPWAALWL